MQLNVEWALNLLYTLNSVYTFFSSDIFYFSQMYFAQQVHCSLNGNIPSIFSTHLNGMCIFSYQKKIIVHLKNVNVHILISVTCVVNNFFSRHFKGDNIHIRWLHAKINL